MKKKDKILNEQLGYLAEQARKATGAETALVMVNFDNDSVVGIGHMPGDGRGKEGNHARAQMIMTLCRVADMICDYQKSGVRVILRSADGSEICEWGTPKIRDLEGRKLDLGLGGKRV